MSLWRVKGPFDQNLYKTDGESVGLDPRLLTAGSKRNPRRLSELFSIYICIYCTENFFYFLLSTPLGNCPVLMSLWEAWVSYIWWLRNLFFFFLAFHNLKNRNTIKFSTSQTKVLLYFFHFLFSKLLFEFDTRMSKIIRVIFFTSETLTFRTDGFLSFLSLPHRWLCNGEFHKWRTLFEFKRIFFLSSVCNHCVITNLLPSCSDIQVSLFLNPLRKWYIYIEAKEKEGRGKRLHGAKAEREGGQTQETKEQEERRCIGGGQSCHSE